MNVSIIKEGELYKAVITAPDGEETVLSGRDIYDLVEEVVLKIEEILGG